MRRKVLSDAIIEAARSAVLESLAKDPWLHDPGAGKKALNFAMHNMAENEDDALVDMAIAGDKQADEVLLETAKEIGENHLGGRLREYLSQRGMRKHVGRRGRKLVTNLYRDEAIFRAMEEAIKFGLSPTRNEATVSESAGSVVADALRNHDICLESHAVETIWQNRAEAREAAGFKTSRWERLQRSASRKKERRLERLPSFSATTGVGRPGQRG